MTALASNSQPPPAGHSAAPPRAATGAASPTHPDQLGLAVWRTLNRTFKNRFSVSFLRALAGGLLTFGILPIFGLSRRFRDYIHFERQQMEHLSEWLRLHHDTEDADALRDLSKTIRFREPLYAIAVACALATLAAFFFLVSPFSVRGLIHHTYDVTRLSSPGKIPLLFILWNALLSIAYLLHWLQIRLYVDDLRRFVAQFNKVTTHQALDPVNPPSLVLGLRLGWIGAAITFVWVGAFWGVPFALAGASQRRYINQTAQRVREQMADRVRAIMSTRAPAPTEPGVTVDYRVHGYRCDRDNCRARLPAGSRFCPRCGAAVSAPSDPIHDDSVGGPA